MANRKIVSVKKKEGDFVVQLGVGFVVAVVVSIIYVIMFGVDDYTKAILSGILSATVIVLFINAINKLTKKGKGIKIRF